MYSCSLQFTSCMYTHGYWRMGAPIQLSFHKMMNNCKTMKWHAAFSWVHTCNIRPFLTFLLGHSDTVAQTQAKDQVSVVCCIQSKQYNFFFLLTFSQIHSFLLLMYCKEIASPHFIVAMLCEKIFVANLNLKVSSYCTWRSLLFDFF